MAAVTSPQIMRCIAILWLAVLLHASVTLQRLLSNFLSRTRKISLRQVQLVFRQGDAREFQRILKFSPRSVGCRALRGILWCSIICRLQIFSVGRLRTKQSRMSLGEVTHHEAPHIAIAALGVNIANGMTVGKSLYPFHKLWHRILSPYKTGCVTMNGKLKAYQG
jgi:hypothetical protein